MAPSVGVVKVAQLPTVAALVRRGQHPAHANPEPGLREAAQEAVLPVIIHVTEVLVLQIRLLRRPNAKTQPRRADDVNARIRN